MNIGSGLGINFYLIDDKEMKDNIIKIAGQNSDFGYSFAFVIGQSYLLNPDDMYGEKIIELVQKNDGFARGLGEGIGISLNGGIPRSIKSRELLVKCWAIAKQNDGFARGLGKATSRETIMKLAKENKAFADELGKSSHGG